MQQIQLLLTQIIEIAVIALILVVVFTFVLHYLRKSKTREQKNVAPKSTYKSAVAKSFYEDNQSSKKESDQLKPKDNNGSEQHAPARPDRSSGKRFSTMEVLNEGDLVKKEPVYFN